MAIPAEIYEWCRSVPWPPEEPSVEPASVKEISNAETRLGFTFPLEFREFLGYLNGPCIGPGGIFGVKPQRSNLDIELNLESFPDWKIKQWIPVAGEECGNYYVLVPGSSSRAVGFVEAVSSPEEIQYLVASGFWKFLIFLLRREIGEKGWPFNEQFVISKDPAILKVDVAPLPWEPSQKTLPFSRLLQPRIRRLRQLAEA